LILDGFVFIGYFATIPCVGIFWVRLEGFFHESGHGEVGMVIIVVGGSGWVLLGE
jgi:hypothetical protein